MSRFVAKAMSSQKIGVFCYNISMADQDKGIEIIRGDGRAEPSLVEGVLRKLLRDGNIRTAAFYKESGVIIDPHYHTEDLAAYVLSGKIRIKTGQDLSNIFEFSPGDGFLMKKGTIHREEMVSEAPVEMTTGLVKDFETIQVEIRE
jgi:quercetin dioxygenase-like cupin family protein